MKSMNNLSLTLKQMGDLTGARSLQEKVIEVMRRILGEEHPDTSQAAWNLFNILTKLNDRDAAVSVVKEDLMWLLDRDSGTLSARQRHIRRNVIKEIERQKLSLL